MGGGDNEIVINAILDTAGFKKGSKEIQKAVGGLGSTMKRMAGTILGVASVYGVLSKAVSTYMAQNEQLSAQMGAVWTALGNVLGPIINQIITWVTTAVSYFLEFLRLLGLVSKSASQLSQKAKKAGQEMKTIAGFDELNVLTKPGGGSPEGRLEDKEAPDWIKDIANFLKQGEWAKAGSALAQKLNDIIASVDWEAIGKKIGYYLNGALTFIATLIKEFDWMGAGGSLAKGLNGLIESVDWSNLGTIMTAKFRILLLSAVGFIQEFDWGNFAKSVGDYFIGVFSSLSETIQQVDWPGLANTIWVALGDMLSSIDWANLASTFFELLGSAIGALSGFLVQLMADLVMWIVDGINDAIAFFSDKIAAAGGDIAQGVLDGITQIWRDIKNWLQENVFDPFINAFKKCFGISSPSKEMKEQGGFIIDGLLEGLKDAFRSVTDWLGGLWNDFNSALSGLISSAWTWGSDLIGNLWNGISSALGNFWSGISGIAGGIASYLGFSEPEKGPLSNFHTYGPDMMKLYAQGIEQNKYRVFSAVEDVASGISDEMHGDLFDIGTVETSGLGGALDDFADEIVGGFEDLVTRLEAIAESVVFAMPAVAGGGVVPYGVAGGSGFYGENNSNTDELLSQLIDMMGDFRKDLENMQFVAQFGDVRAIAREISKVQKQEERARG